MNREQVASRFTIYKAIPDPDILKSYIVNSKS